MTTASITEHIADQILKDVEARHWENVFDHITSPNRQARERVFQQLVSQAKQVKSAYLYGNQESDQIKNSERFKINKLIAKLIDSLSVLKYKRDTRVDILNALHFFCKYTGR